MVGFLALPADVNASDEQGQIISVHCDKEAPVIKPDIFGQWVMLPKLSTSGMETDFAAVIFENDFTVPDSTLIGGAASAFSKPLTST